MVSLEAGQEEAGGDGFSRAQAKAGEEAAGVSDKQPMFQLPRAQLEASSNPEQGGECTAAAQADGEHVVEEAIAENP
jgi:hypothetical protein